MPLSIATWNVNSIKSRMHQLLPWLESAAPDVALLQELKCVTEAVPYMEIEALGYNVVAHGQKTYNGVAILSKYPVEDVVKGLPPACGGAGGGARPETAGNHSAEITTSPNVPLPAGPTVTQSPPPAPPQAGGSDDPQARYIEAIVTPPGGEAVRVASVYVPNGNEVGSEKFAYKLAFFARLKAHLETLRQYEEMVVIGGDYNVAPADGDVYDADKLNGSVCFHPDERAAFRQLEHLGYLDAYRLKRPLAMGNDDFTWWDYRGGAFAKGAGMRIDHLLISPQAADKLTDCTVHRELRGEEKPSDHVPVVGSFEI